MSSHEISSEKSNPPSSYSLEHPAALGATPSECAPDEYSYDTNFEGDGRDVVTSSPISDENLQKSTEMPSGLDEVWIDKEADALPADAIVLSAQCDQSSDWLIGQQDFNSQSMGIEIQLNPPSVFQVRPHNLHDTVSLLLTVYLKFWNCSEESDSCVETDTSYYSMLDHDSDNDIIRDHETMVFQAVDAPITYMPEHGANDNARVGERDNCFVGLVTDLPGSLTDLVDFGSD